MAEDGSRTTHFATTEGDARKLLKACMIDLGVPLNRGLTVEQAIDGFMNLKRDSGAWDIRTFERTGSDLRKFAEAVPDAPLNLVNASWVRGYLARISHLALASQKSRYYSVCEFLAWCVAKGHLKVNPTAALDRTDLPWVGKRAQRQVGRGKPQLRNSGEAAAYLAAAGALTTAKDRVAATLPLLTGLRSGAVRHLRVSDIDFGVGRIWSRNIEDDEAIPVEWDVKTASSQMTVEIPEVVRADLEALCAGRETNEFVFASSRHRSMRGGPHDRKWLNRLVHEVCEAAGTRVVCAHGLRDTYTSLLAALGAKSAADIAKLVGHDDEGQTAKRNYIGVPEHRPALRGLVTGGGIAGSN